MSTLYNCLPLFVGIVSLSHNSLHLGYLILLWYYLTMTNNTLEQHYFRIIDNYGKIVFSPLTIPPVRKYSYRVFFSIRDFNIREMIIESFIEIFKCQMSFNSTGCENCLFLFEYFYPILLTIYSEPGACQTINTKISTIPMIMGPTLSPQSTLLTCLYIYLFCRLPSLLPPPSRP